MEDLRTGAQVTGSPEGRRHALQQRTDELKRLNALRQETFEDAKGSRVDVRLWNAELEKSRRDMEALLARMDPYGRHRVGGARPGGTGGSAGGEPMDTGPG